MIVSIVFLANAIGVFFGLVLLAQPQPAQPQALPAHNQVTPTTGVPDLQAVREEAERLKIQFEYWEKRATQMQILVGLILAINSLYAVALAAGAYFNLKPLLESARRELDDLRRYVEKAPKDTEDRIKEAEKKVTALIKDARTDLEEFRSEIRADLPTLQNMDKALRNILAEIRRRLPTDKNWRDPAYYSSVPVAEREQIRYAELTVAGFKFFDLGKISSFQTIVSEIYRGLGEFYGSNFASTKAKVSSDTSDGSLFERAFLYFEEAYGIQPDNAAAYKDVGVLYTVAGEDPQRRNLARQSFEHCLQIDPTEPGASFGLGWLEYKDEHWEKAIRHFSTLIQKTDWRAAERKKLQPDAYLNRACCRARSLDSASGDTEYDQIVSDCNEGLKLARDLGELDGFSRRLNTELNTTGDLGAFATRFPEKVRELRA